MDKYTLEIRNTSPIIRDFLNYIGVIKSKSKLTVDEYYVDLRTFFRFMKSFYGLIDPIKKFEEIDISDIDINFIKKITLSDIYEYLNYCMSERGNVATTRARKSSSLRAFFNYLTNKKHLLEVNPVQELDIPKSPKKMPIYLTLEECVKLFEAVDGSHKERDYCILTLFLNCGMRLSELCGINLSDISSENTLKIMGKGSKERIIYLNDACIYAINAYLKVRPVDRLPLEHKDALFISNQHKRISNKTVQYIVKYYIEKAGLGDRGFSVHKLRHTAATLMHQYGNVDIRVLKDVLGHESLATTQIYTHLSNKQLEEASKSNPLSTIKPKKNDNDS